MKRNVKKWVLGLLVMSIWGAAGFAGCSSNPGQNNTGGMTGSGGDVGPKPDASDDSPINFFDTGTGCPSTCAQLGADCGTVTDTACGGVVSCGTCPAGKTCGGDGPHNVCGTGSNPDACAPLSCMDQGVTCGAAGDGCGNTLQCGACALPQSCGGDPTKPGQCGCTGVCAQIPSCPPATTTTLTGTVYDPAGLHPLYHALVYIPNNPMDPGLQPFAAGISCDQCGATAAGDPLVTTFTAPDGTFTLQNVPVGSSIALVVQLGRWRRQFTVDITSSCAANSVPPMTLKMPKNHNQGDIPRIGILSGGLDPVECVLRKMGVDDTEFTNPGNGGHINFYLASETDPHNNGVQGYGPIIDGATPTQAALFAAPGGNPVINQYDLVILECEGYPQSESAADKAGLHAYAEAGGRVFASDFAYAWLYQNGNFAQAANWAVNQQGGGFSQTGVIDLVSNPKGPDFKTWLEIVGVSAPGSGNVGSIYPAFHNSNAVVTPTQQWLYWGAQTPMHFTFNTPVGAPSDQQCGRVVYSDWHAQSGNFTHGKVFPTECSAGPMTQQEAILEFMLFDLTACVQPYTPVCTPKTCAEEGVDCGPSGDGCGGLLDCGMCPAGQTCGGNGPGKCGNASNCVPLNCLDQGIECGPAGDGCGNLLSCGNCPTGAICGLSGPGKCGMVK
jgi:hypothetical protein